MPELTFYQRSSLALISASNNPVNLGGGGQNYSLTLDLDAPLFGKIWIVRSIGCFVFINSIQAGLEAALSILSVVNSNANSVNDPAVSIGNGIIPDLGSRGLPLLLGSQSSIVRGSTNAIVSAALPNLELAITLSQKIRMVYTPTLIATGISVRAFLWAYAIQIDSVGC